MHFQIRYTLYFIQKSAVFSSHCFYSVPEGTFPKQLKKGHIEFKSITTHAYYSASKTFMNNTQL